MKIALKKLPQSQVQIEVKIDKAKTASYFKKAAEVLSTEYKIPGFRAGKAPFEVVCQQLGQSLAYQKVAQLAVNDTLPDIILEKCLKTVGPPRIKIAQLAPNQPLKFEAQVAILPKIENKSWHNLKIKKRKLQVTTKEIDEALTFLRKSRASFITTSRPCRKGDRIEIDFIARVGGVKIQGGESQNHPLILGEGRFMPGFEEHLEGLKVNDTKTFSLIAPKTFPDPGLRDKKIDFEVKVRLVQEVKLPSLTDEWAQSLGKFKSLEDLKTSLKKGILYEKEEKEKERLREEILERLIQKNQIPAPDILVQNEVQRLKRLFQQNLKDSGLTLPIFLQKIGKNEEELERGWEKQAEINIKRALLLEAIAQKEKIRITAEEIETQMNDFLKRYRSIQEAEKEVNLPALRTRLQNKLRQEKIFELLEKHIVENF